METKLTLRLKSKTIENGFGIAKKKKTSLSKLVENYLDKLTEPQKEEITPLVKSISGMVNHQVIKKATQITLKESISNGAGIY